MPAWTSRSKRRRSASSTRAARCAGAARPAASPPPWPQCCGGRHPTSSGRSWRVAPSRAGCAVGWSRRGLPALCIDARVAHGALKQRRSQTDRGDADGLVRLSQTGWFKMVRLRSRASRERHGLLAARERLVRIQRDLSNQIRGLAKPLGLVLPRTTAGRQRGLTPKTSPLTPKTSPTSAARPRPRIGTVAAVVRHMRDQSGVLACAIGHAFEMAPPLTATQDQLDRAVQATARAVHEVAQARGLASGRGRGRFALGAPSTMRVDERYHGSLTHGSSGPLPCQIVA